MNKRMSNKTSTKKMNNNTRLHVSYHPPYKREGGFASSRCPQSPACLDGHGRPLRILASVVLRPYPLPPTPYSVADYILYWKSTFNSGK